MNRLNEDNDLISLIYDLEKQSNEIKNKQIVGADAVRTNKLGTAATWDRDVTMPAAFAETTQNFTIRFVPDNPIDGKPPAAFQVAVDQLVTGEYQYIEFVRARITINRKKVVDPLIQEWSVSVRYAGGYGTPVRYRLKFYVMATGMGSITLL